MRELLSRAHARVCRFNKSTCGWLTSLPLAAQSAKKSLAPVRRRKPMLKGFATSPAHPALPRNSYIPVQHTQVTFLCFAERKVTKRNATPVAAPARGSRAGALRFQRYAILLRLKPGCAIHGAPAQRHECTLSAFVTTPLRPRQRRAARELAGGETLAARARTPRAEIPQRWLRCSACSTGF